MNADFIRIAHRKAVWAELRRVLLERYIAEDAPPKEQIICEDVPYRNKEVTNEALLECLDELQQLELDEQVEMSKFEMRRRTDRARRQLSEQQPQQPSDGEPAAAPVAAKPKSGFDHNPDGSPEPRDEEGGEGDGEEGEADPESVHEAAPSEGERRRERSGKAG